MLVELNKKEYHTCIDEFNTIHHNEYNNLIIKDKLGYYERIVSLLCELSKLNISELICYNQTHGGFVPLNCSTHFTNTYILKTDGIQQYNINQNIVKHNIGNISWQLNKEFKDLIIYSENFDDIDLDFINNYEPIMLTNYDTILLQLNKYEHYYQLTNTDLYLYIPNHLHELFVKHFYYYIDSSNNTFN